METLIKAISKYPNETKIVIKYKNTFEIKGEIDTIYETNNDFEMEEEGYKEYYACAVRVLSLLSVKAESSNVKVGSLIEISMQEPPLGIYLEDGSVIWEDENYEGNKNK